ncbi:MAG TPA: hypothetical protein VFG47_14150 [Geminicoccaceae bacterium]|nr:hypothetical protein [Geminicoccaceae bacterium]
MRVRFRCPPGLEGVLPRPVPARRGLPDWLRAMPPAAFSDELGMEVRTVKRCPPFIDAMGSGFLMPLACDLRVEPGPRFEWDFPAPASLPGGTTRSPIGVHVAAQVAGSPLFEADGSVLKFNNFWTVELDEPGWSLLVTHPFNREDLPFRTLTGLVEGSFAATALVHFPARWLDADFIGVLERGTPVAQCVPVPKEALELEFGTLEGEAAERFVAVKEAVGAAPGAYRRGFRGKD